MLTNIRPNNVLFLDIETVPVSPNYESLSDSWKALWDKKAIRIGEEKESPSDCYNRAGIYAEFGKVVCISIGIYRDFGTSRIFKLKSFACDDEAVLLKDFCLLLESHFNQDHHLLCAHNGREFDFPYLARRILVNKLSLPSLLDIAGRKPWEIQHLDTLQLWKFGDYKHYTSLDLLSQLFEIKSPKGDLDGSKIYKAYWEEKSLSKIQAYCEQDVTAVCQLFLAYKGIPLLNPSEIKFSSES